MFFVFFIVAYSFAIVQFFMMKLLYSFIRSGKFDNARCFVIR